MELFLPAWKNLSESVLREETSDRAVEKDLGYRDRWTSTTVPDGIYTPS